MHRDQGPGHSSGPCSFVCCLRLAARKPRIAYRSDANWRSPVLDWASTALGSCCAITTRRSLRQRSTWSAYPPLIDGAHGNGIRARTAQVTLYSLVRSPLPSQVVSCFKETNAPLMRLPSPPRASCCALASRALPRSWSAGPALIVSTRMCQPSCIIHARTS